MLILILITNTNTNTNRMGPVDDDLADIIWYDMIQWCDITLR